MAYLKAHGIKVSVHGANLEIRFERGGSYIAGSAYDATSFGRYDSLTANTIQSSSVAGGDNIVVGKGINLTAGWGGGLVAYFFDTQTTSNHQRFCVGQHVSSENALNDLAVYNFGGRIDASTSALTGIRFICSSGNIDAGDFRLYGMANS